MQRQCTNCQQAKLEVARKTAKVQILEQELATCQQSLRNKTSQLEKAAKKMELMDNELQWNHRRMEAELQNITSKYAETREALQDAIVAREKQLETVRSLKRSEASKDKEIEELRALNRELKTAKPAPVDSETVSMLIQRVQTLEAAALTAAPAPPPTTEPTRTIPEALTLEDRKIMLNEMKFTMEAYDPVALADEIFKNVVEKTKDPVLMVEARIVMDEFKDEFDQYMRELNRHIAALSTSNESSLKEMPNFPDPFDANFMAKIETILKQKKSTAEPTAQKDCSICRTAIGDDYSAKACVGCKVMYHTECGRVFADENLPCSTPNCTKTFRDTKWT